MGWEMKHRIELDEYWPYIVIMPMDPSKRASYMLTLFSTSISLEVLNLFKWDEELCQKDIISTLRHHSNKTIINTLRKLVKLKLLNEEIKTIKYNNRVARVKCYRLTDIGKWYNLLFKDPRTFDRETLRVNLIELITWFMNRLKTYDKEFNIDIVKSICSSIADVGMG